MNKIEFLAAVSAALGALPPEEIKGHINFLSEMIDDRVEEGLTEAEAIAAMGNPDHGASAILSDTVLSSHAETIEVGTPSATSSAWVGPERAATVYFNSG